MNRSRKIVAGVAAVALGTGLAYIALVSSQAARSADDPTEIVYVDTKSGATFLLASRNSPEENPETGARTLVPGLYCSECLAWKPVGPLDNRRIMKVTAKCPVHKIALTTDGPPPD